MRLLTWLKALWPWLKETASVAVFALGFVIVIAIALWWPCEPALRYAGLALQILGILTVAWDIKETRKHFQHPTFLTRAKQWWHRHPKWRHDTTLVIGTAHGTLRASGVAVGNVGLPPDA